MNYITKKLEEFDENFDNGYYGGGFKEPIKSFLKQALEEQRELILDKLNAEFEWDIEEFNKVLQIINEKIK